MICSPRNSSLCSSRNVDCDFRRSFALVVICCRTVAFNLPRHLHQIRSPAYRFCRFVHFCFSCENFLLGKICNMHHAKECCSQNQSQPLSHASLLRRSGSNGNHTWIRCNTCARQSNLAKCSEPLVAAPHKWGRLLVLLYKKHRATAPTTQSSHRAVFHPEVMTHIATFLG